MKSPTLFQCRDVQRLFHSPSGRVTGLDQIQLTIGTGEFISISGPSGCGKSTLLLTLGGMLRPSQGQVLYNDQDMYALPASERTRLRAREIGFVFQLFHLVPYLSVQENIRVGHVPGDGPPPSGARIGELLEELGLTHRAKHMPGTLSAGERQRVALARALIKKPRVILADEPTGNLDPDNAAGVFRHLGDFQKKGGTVVVVTHGTDAIQHATRNLRLKNGRIETETAATVAATLA